MGFFSPKVKKGPSAEQIRKEEEARLKAENLQNIQEQEEKRKLRRASFLQQEGEQGDISRKTLFGE